MSNKMQNPKVPIPVCCLQHTNIFTCAVPPHTKASLRGSSPNKYRVTEIFPNGTELRGIFCEGLSKLKRAGSKLRGIDPLWIKRLTILLAIAVSLILSSCFGPSGDEHAKKGIELLDSGDYQTAVIELKAAIKKGVKSYDEERIYTCLGITYSWLEEYDNAIAMHEKAIEINPEYHKAWVNLGIEYRKKNNLDEAERCYLKALEIKPNYEELHSSIGALYIFKKNPQKAVEHLERAVALNPRSIISRSNLAYAYAMLGDFKKADESLTRAIHLGYRSGSHMRKTINALKEKRKN